MEDLVLKAEIDEHTTLYVSTIDRRTYDEHVTEDNLGGGDGYFVIRSWKRGDLNRFEVLAKSPTFAAAGDIFDMIVGSANRNFRRF